MRLEGRRSPCYCKACPCQHLTFVQQPVLFQPKNDPCHLHPLRLSHFSSLSPRTPTGKLDLNKDLSLGVDPWSAVSLFQYGNYMKKFYYCPNETGQVPYNVWLARVKAEEVASARAQSNSFIPQVPQFYMFTTLSYVVVEVSALTVIAPNGPVGGWVGVPFLAGLYDDQMMVTMANTITSTITEFLRMLIVVNDRR